MTRNFIVDYGIHAMRTLAMLVAGFATALCLYDGRYSLATVTALTALGLYVWSIQENINIVRTSRAIRLASDTGAETEIVLPDGSRHVVGAVPLVAPEGTHFVTKDGKQVLEAISRSSSEAVAHQTTGDPKPHDRGTDP